MKCPHCLKELNYRERRGRQCPKCKQKFALEPRDNRLGLTDLNLPRLAERLSGKGVYRYTSLQLGHAAVLRRYKSQPAKIYPWPTSRRSLRTAIIIFLLVVGLMLLMPAGLIAYLGIVDLGVAACFMSLCLSIGILLGLSIADAYRHPISKYNLENFEHKYISPWENMYAPLPGRITSQEMELLGQVQIPSTQVRAVVVSPVDDVLSCLHANGLPQRLGLVLINPDRPLTDEMQTLIAFVRQHPQVPMLLLHDASISGCLLPYLLRDRWELTPRHQVIDLGLRPRHVQRLRLPWTFVGRTPKALIDLLEYEVQRQDVLALEQDELKWLREGPVASVLFIPPARLIKVVTRAVERIEQRAPQVVDAETQARARAIGFMTWPRRSVSGG
ncbi:MAG: ABC transporter permease [Chloroflexaceae bacterium]